MTYENLLAAYNVYWTVMPPIVAVATLTGASVAWPRLRAVRSLEGLKAAVTCKTSLLLRASLIVALAPLLVAWAARHGGLSDIGMIALDAACFAVMALPPRSYWQAAIAGMFFAALIIDLLKWALADIMDLSLLRWEVLLALGFCKIVTLAFWAGGQNGLVLRVGKAVRRRVYSLLGLGSAPPSVA